MSGVIPTRSHSLEAIAGPSTQPIGSHSMAPSDSIGHCTFCILAEFDIDRGSTLAYQYPGPTGYDEHMLAELMLPDGAHARTEDWTVFFLKPPKAALGEKQDPGDRTASPDSQAWRSDNLTYVINLVRTKHDSSVRRGALVKALAIGTRHPFIDVFKPALLMALDDYFKEPGEECLATLYDAVNKLDLSAAPVYTRAEKLVLRASERRDLLEERFTSPLQDTEEGQIKQANVNQGHAPLSSPPGSDIVRPRADSVSTTSSDTKSLRKKFNVPSNRPSLSKTRDSSASSIAAAFATTTYSDNRRTMPSNKPRDTHYYDTTLNYRNLQLPIRVPLTTFAEEVGDYSLIKLIQTFSGPQSTPSGPLHPHLHTNGASTHPIILLFNALVTQKRVIFLGYGQPANHVASFVLAACALISGCGALLKGFAARAFPYTNLLNLDELEKVPGYIAGVTNPRFEDLRAWDVLFNVSTGKVQVAKDIAAASSASQAADRGKASTMPRDGISSNSLASMAGSSGIGHDARSFDTDLGQFGALPSSTASGFVGKASSLGGVIGDGRDRVMGSSDGKMDAVSPLFMEELQWAIASHYGERYVRSRVSEYVSAFIRGVARHEEHFYGQTLLGPTCQPFLNGQLGAGPVYADRDSEMREILANQMRVEGFRTSVAYQMLAQDLEAQGGFSETIRDFDIAHQIGRLRRAKTLAVGESDLIFDTIAKSVVAQDQITELLSLMPPHNGGLLPLGLGLFHPSAVVRNTTVDIFLRLCRHSLGRIFVQSMHTYQRLAFARLAQERAEQTQAQSFTAASFEGPRSNVSRPVSNGTLGSGRNTSDALRA